MAPATFQLLGSAIRLHVEPAAFSLLEWRTPPHAPAPPLHLHRQTDEAVYVASGRLATDIDGEQTTHEELVARYDVEIAGGATCIPLPRRAAGRCEDARAASDAGLGLAVRLGQDRADQKWRRGGSAAHVLRRVIRRLEAGRTRTFSWATSGCSPASPVARGEFRDHR